MQEQGYISTTDYENAKNSKIDLKLNEKAYDFNSLCLIELNQISKDNRKKIYITSSIISCNKIYFFNKTS